MGNSAAPNYWSPRSAAQTAITASANSMKAGKTPEKRTSLDVVARTVARF
jgi:hypothetical protein